MTGNRLMPLWLVLLGVTATWGAYPLPYPGLDVSSVPITPHFIYSSPFADGDFRGYSYFTSDLGGGGNSEVLFFTGADSKNALDNEANFMHGTKKTGVFKSTTEKGVASTTDTTIRDSGSSSVGSDSTVDRDTVTVTSTVSSIDSPASTDASSTKSSVIPKSGKDPKQKTRFSFDQRSGFGSGELSPFGISSFGAPYPIFRFGGAPSFYPPVSTSYSGFLEPSYPFRSDYQPNFDSFNSFQNYDPYFSPQGNYWNTDYLPSFYQNPFYSHSFGNVFKTLKPITTDSPKTSTPAGKSGSESPKTAGQLPEATFRSAPPSTMDALPDKSTETVAPTTSSKVPSLADDSTIEPTTAATVGTTTVA